MKKANKAIYHSVPRKDVFLGPLPCPLIQHHIVKPGDGVWLGEVVPWANSLSPDSWRKLGCGPGAVVSVVYISGTFKAIMIEQKTWEPLLRSAFPAWTAPVSPPGPWVGLGCLSISPGDRETCEVNVLPETWGGCPTSCLMQDSSSASPPRPSQDRLPLSLLPTFLFCSQSHASSASTALCRALFCNKETVDPAPWSSHSSKHSHFFEKAAKVTNFEYLQLSINTTEISSVSRGESIPGCCLLYHLLPPEKPGGRGPHEINLIDFFLSFLKETKKTDA